MAERKTPTPPKGSASSKQKFRLILQEEGTFAERWAMRVQPGQIRALAALSIALVAAITYALVALTPLKEAVVPGYLSTETREMQQQAMTTADSLSQVLAMQGRYIQNLRAVLMGDLPAGALGAMTDIPTPNDVPAPTLGPQSGAALEGLKTRVEEEDAFAIGSPGSLDESGLWIPPVEGRVSAGWNPGLDHWGVDIVAPEDSPVKAVGDGTVIFAGFTTGGGHTLLVQHPGDRVSVYMHNSRLEVGSGDRVRQGEMVAVIGNSGDHSSGPHLHFEWWESGVAIDPQLRISLR
ncbi:MAG: hypothetical protein CMC97_07180 [Flavobacteriales bacterium]|nr:hypothetical protein [Flavobacteriales bacterium]